MKSVVCEGAKSLGPRDLWPTGLLLPPGHEPLVHEPLQEGHHPSLPSRPPHPWGRPWGRARPRAQPQCHTPIPTPPPPHHRDVRTTKDTKAGPPEASVPIREIRGSKHLAHPPLFPAGFKPPQQTTDAADNTDTPAHRPPHSPPSHPCPSVKSVVQNTSPIPLPHRRVQATAANHGCHGQHGYTCASTAPFTAQPSVPIREIRGSTTPRPSPSLTDPARPWPPIWGRARPRAPPNALPRSRPPPPHHRDVRTTKYTKHTKAGPPQPSVPICEIRGSTTPRPSPFLTAGFKSPQQTTDVTDNKDSPSVGRVPPRGGPHAHPPTTLVSHQISIT